MDNVRVLIDGKPIDGVKSVEFRQVAKDDSIEDFGFLGDAALTLKPGWQVEAIVLKENRYGQLDVQTFSTDTWGITTVKVMDPWSTLVRIDTLPNIRVTPNIFK